MFALRLKHKLLIFWLGTVLVSLALVGGLFAYMVTNLHEETSKKKILEAFGILRTQLDTRTAVLTKNVTLLARRQDVIASSSMISTYQDTSNYRSIIFDVEKKKLAWELAKQARVTDLDIIAAYDKNLKLNSYVMFDTDGAAQIGYVTYRNGQPAILTTDDARSSFEESSGLSKIFDDIVPGQLPLKPEVVPKQIRGALALVIAAPVNRLTSGGAIVPAGMIVAADVLDERFMRSTSHLVGMEITYITDGDKQVGLLKVAGLGGMLSEPPFMKDLELSSSASWWFPHNDYYLGAARSPLADGGTATFVIGLKRGQLKSEIAAFKKAVIWVIVLAAILVIPCGLFFANRTITVPVEKLMQGVVALRDGQHGKLTGFNSKDELHDLAQSFNDMSETIQRREAELNELNETLEATVATRTAQLEVANQELESFAYSVSHDLRAPLRTVDGFSHILLSDHAEALDDRGKNYLGRIRAGIHRMGDLIDDLLTLSRSTRGDMKNEQVDISRIATRVIDGLRESDRSREVKVEIEPDVSGYGDQQLIGVVLENLVGNAWKYTGNEEHPHISFGITKHGKGDKTYFIKDNGAGFDEKYSDKLFSPFQRLHHSNEFEGNGVGLATVKRIITRHGGNIWAKASVGEGATFYFTLGTGTDPS